MPLRQTVYCRVGEPIPPARELIFVRSKVVAPVILWTHVCKDFEGVFAGDYFTEKRPEDVWHFIKALTLEKNKIKLSPNKSSLASTVGECHQNNTGFSVLLKVQWHLDHRERI